MKEYNVLQYGAAGDGVTNDAFAIQHAICLLYTSDAADEL